MAFEKTSYGVRNHYGARSVTEEMGAMGGERTNEKTIVVPVISGALADTTHAPGYRIPKGAVGVGGYVVPVSGSLTSGTAVTLKNGSTTYVTVTPGANNAITSVAISGVTKDVVVNAISGAPSSFTGKIVIKYLSFNGDQAVLDDTTFSNDKTDATISL